MKKSLLASSIILASSIVPAKNFRFGEDGGDGGDGGQGGSLDLTSSEAQAAIQAAAQTLMKEQHGGLQTKNDELLGKINDLKQNAKQFEGLDAGKIKTMLDALDQSEEASLLAEGKLEEVIQRRIDRVSTDHSSEVQTLTEQLETANKNSTMYKDRLDSNTIRNEVSKFALESGVLPEALNDVVGRAQSTFQVDTNGNVVALDKEGFVLKENGIEVTPERFVDSLKKTSAYYWGSSKGGDAVGNRGGLQIDGSSQKGAQAAAEIVGNGAGFDLEEYRKARGTGINRK